MPGYGTLAPSQEEWEWEKKSTPFQLALTVGISVGKNAAALLLLFWQLFKQRSFLMSCDMRKIGNWAYLCEYTKTFIRCFPLLSTTVVMIIAARQLLQLRVYYGILKRGALLDFRNTKAWHDPLFFLLVFSFMHGLTHFTMDLFIADAYHTTDLIPGAPHSNEMQEELKSMFKHFILPSVLFFAFLASSYDLESQLIPLSKYFEENPSVARQTAARMPFLDEEEVKKVIPTLSLKTSSEKTTLNAVYLELIEKTPELSMTEIKAQSTHGFSWHLFSSLWPAKILLDPKLNCDESRGFRRLVILVTFINFSFFTVILVYFCYQVWKDILDVSNGQYEDSVSLSVLALHALFLFFVQIHEVRLAKEIFF